MKAQVIRLQGYKDWKDGLITTEEMLKGRVYREPEHLRSMWLRIIARATGNWENVPHHHLCCCDKCAPNEEDRLRKMQMHDEEHAKKSALDESMTIEELLEEENVRADEDMPEIDLEQHTFISEELRMSHDPLCCCEACIDELFNKDYENLAPSDCEPE